MALPITFPTTVPSDLKTIRGAPRLFVGAYVTAGADQSSPAYFGQIEKGSLSFKNEFSDLKIEGEESLCASDTAPDTESHGFTCTLLEVPIATLNQVFGGVSANIVTTGGGSTYSSIGLGGMYQTIASAGWENSQLQHTFYQIYVRHPVERASAGATLYGYRQFYKCRIRPAGNMTVTRGGVMSLPIEVEALWDWNIASAIVNGGPGMIGRYVIATA